MKMFFKKIMVHRLELRSIFKTIYFNFHYLPFTQAIRLPILLYKPRLLKLKGKVIIQGDVKYGMIKLGFPRVSLYPNSGVMIENHGGTIVFKGMCYIGNNSYISIGEKGFCSIGSNIVASTTFRIVCYHNIELGNRNRFGWDCMFMDTDFHKLTKLAGGYSKGYAKIRTGSNNWFGNGCLIMKRTETPDYCVVSARTVLAGRVDVPEYCVVGQKNEIVIKATGVWRNVDDSKLVW